MAISYLTPFLDVVRAEETDGPTTSLALTSLNKFIVLNLIGKNFFIFLYNVLK